VTFSKFASEVAKVVIIGIVGDEAEEATEKIRDKGEVITF